MWIVPLPKDHLGGSHGKKDDYDIVFMITMVVKQRRWIVDVSTWNMTPLDIELKAFSMSN
jgi:hypothetical protein